MEKKVALFDVDKTIIKKDSMFLFLWYTIYRRPFTIYILIPVLIYSLLYKLNLVPTEKVKEYYFYGMKYFDNTNLRDFYEKHIKKNLYKDAIKEMLAKKHKGYMIILVSASPLAYIKFFKELPYVDEVIGTELMLNEERYLNKIKGKNCKAEEKVNRLNEYLYSSGMSIDYDNSFAFSDSLSDLPMLHLVKNKFIVNRKDLRDMEVLTWK